MTEPRPRLTDTNMSRGQKYYCDLKYDNIWLIIFINVNFAQIKKYAVSSYEKN